MGGSRGVGGWGDDGFVNGGVMDESILVIIVCVMDLLTQRALLSTTARQEMK